MKRIVTLILAATLAAAASPLTVQAKVASKEEEEVGALGQLQASRASMTGGRR